MTTTQNQNPAADAAWNHSTPVVFSPLFAWPPRPKAALLTLTQRWFTISRSVLFLTMAVLVHKYLLPVSEQMKSLTGSWVALVFLSNFLFMLLIAGGLHLFLFTFRLQVKQLKQDHRETAVAARGVTEFVAKAAANRRKHQINFDEDSTAFSDPLAVIFDDERHSQNERREIIIGHSIKDRLLVVAFTERSATLVRIISARKATKRERAEYEEGTDR